jgi:hypothetical protein
MRNFRDLEVAKFCFKKKNIHNYWLVSQKKKYGLVSQINRCGFNSFKNGRLPRTSQKRFSRFTNKLRFGL